MSPGYRPHLAAVGTRHNAVMVGRDIDSVLSEFVDAFNRLELERFMDLWERDASLFHPFPEMAKRLAADEVREGWSRVFSLIREATPGPPYMDLRPTDLQITELGEDARLVTFHLEVPGALARRSMVLRRDGGGWKIVHLHGSNLTTS